MKHTIYSNVSESMKQIYEAHWETGNEVSSTSGKLIAFAQRKALEAKKTNYDIKYKDGVRRIVKGDKERSVGVIVNKQGMTLKTKLSNFIQWRTYSTSGTTVVAGMFTNGWTEIRENGKVIDRERVYSVGQGSINILQKLNYGLNSDSSRINEVNNAYSWDYGKSMPNFEGSHTEGYEFAEDGFEAAKDDVFRTIRDGFSSALARREKGIKAEMKKAV